MRRMYIMNDVLKSYIIYLQYNYELLLIIDSSPTNIFFSCYYFLLPLISSPAIIFFSWHYFFSNHIFLLRIAKSSPDYFFLSGLLNLLLLYHIYEYSSGSFISQCMFILTIHNFRSCHYLYLLTSVYKIINSFHPSL